eukprot:TRINITY_DN4967_c0_g1_i1.p1 TRINITY_DN4967_c0_g1~~TRINITY_DN4967_c0_g1_i1.p1  ORF type:complete len:188 (-),score=7.94 TRINITY_DN4967_c0_g1_i1:3-566(-)
MAYRYSRLKESLLINTKVPKKGIPQSSKESTCSSFIKRSSPVTTNPLIRVPSKRKNACQDCPSQLYNEDYCCVRESRSSIMQAGRVPNVMEIKLGFNRQAMQDNTIRRHASCESKAKTIGCFSKKAVRGNTVLMCLKHKAVANALLSLMTFKEYLRYLLAVSYTHLRAHETSLHLVCRLLLEKKKKK